LHVSGPLLLFQIKRTRVPSLVLIAQAVFLFRVRTNRQTAHRQTDRRDWTPYPRRRLCRGNIV